nr:MAG TPA: hypothetical protein [Caudoviricetes sp.]
MYKYTKKILNYKGLRDIFHKKKRLISWLSNGN